MSDRISGSRLARQLAGWDGKDGALHTLLAHAIRELIRSGAIARATTLPSQRELAQALAVSRTTVGHAYQELGDEGWISTHHGSGTRVRTTALRSGPLAEDDRLGTYAIPSESFDLSSGVLSTSPLLRRVLRSNWDQDLRRLSSNDRFMPWGINELRVAVAHYYAEVNTPTEPDQVLATNGSHHALTLLVSCLLEPGDTVLVEDPTYRGALDVFSRRGVNVVGIACDDDGPIPSELIAAIRKHTPRMIYTIPTAHNVTGITWSPRRREQIADSIRQFGVPLLDDGSTADLHSGPHPGHLASLLPAELSITIGSLTKLFWSGLRVGWIRATEPVLKAALNARVTSDLAGSIPSQVLTSACLPIANDARTLRRKELGHTRTLATSLIKDWLPTWEFDESRGGACLWINTKVNSVQLASRLRRNNILIVPGPDFSPCDNWQTHVRIPLGDPGLLEEAIPAISKTVGILNFDEDM
ncbi:aminotransferase-like domain-containing protein [Flaviflexus massiliensis]|uniref:aminotransferase-like domain-containing protein n=1 Tax=Flaviflexus massiliensis TaxID=1522309 RepID=UPI0011C8ADAD|nr:PLP-dependent aminotransferase family protein [Flaviflexus massiliensis]